MEQAEPGMSEPIITLADIERIAELASLELTGEEKAQFVQQFEDILNYFKKIDAVKLPPPHDPPSDSADHLRDDVARPSGITPDSFSPYLENGHFKVPKVIE
jgi:aspartyl/glutamyl-tRNA(Asn/Gln) amidotransferase C subunit